MYNTRLDELKKYAKIYHDLGFVVIRIKPKSKNAYSEWYLKTYDNDDTYCNWKDDDNIGVLLGPESNLVCFTIKNNINNELESINWWTELLQTRKISTLITISTEGIHNYFKFESLNDFLKYKNISIKIPQKKFAAKLKTLYYYNLLYPSIININGIDYTYEKFESLNNINISNMPEWLTNLIMNNNENQSGLNILIKYLREIWCNNDNKLYNYLIKWFACIFQRKKTNIPIVIYSTSKFKNTVIDFICNKLLGEYYIKLDSWDKILDYSFINNKRLVYGENLSIKNISNSQKLIETLIVKDNTNYIFCVNDLCELNINNKYLWLDLKRNNKFYINNKFLNEQTARDFYEFLLKVNLNDFSEYVFNDSVYYYISYLINHNWNRILKKNKNNINFVQSKKLWENYISWCKMTNKNVSNRIDFQNKLNNIGFEKKKISFNNTRITAYILNIESVKQKLQENLTC
ncbi:MAG: hypothetical protein QW303_01100 [Nitrososphaerota archaeon]